MPTVYRADEFDGWLRKLRDKKARQKVNVRIQRLANGNPGDVAPVGEGVSEMRIDYGPGYRVYYKTKADSVTLLWGGVKDSQARDIEIAKRLAKEWE